jgi:hypothetical protein
MTGFSSGVSPLAVALHAHSMAAAGQHHLAIHLHANATFLLPLDINLRNRPLALVLVCPSVSLYTDRLLPPVVDVADPLGQLHEGGKYNSCKQCVSIFEGQVKTDASPIIFL